MNFISMLSVNNKNNQQSYLVYLPSYHGTCIFNFKKFSYR